MKKFLGIVFLSLFFNTSSWGITPSCQSTDYKSPCTCKYSDTKLEEMQCKLKKKRAASGKPKKLKRSEAIKVCARQAENYSQALSAEIYKDCMIDKGFR